MENNKFKKNTVLAQILILVGSMFAFSFLISAASPMVSAAGGDSPVIRNIPAGVSDQPYAKKLAQQWGTLSKTEAEQIVAGWAKQTNTDNSAVRKANLNIKDLESLGTINSILAMKAFHNFAIWQVFQARGSFASKGLSFGGKAIGGAYILEAAYIASKLVVAAFELMGTSSRNSQQLNNAALVTTGVVGGGGVAIWLFTSAALGPVVLGAAIAAAITMLWIQVVNYKDYSREIFTYQVGLWQPPYGHKYCGLCQDPKLFPYGCSEYQCHTLGTDCYMVNLDTVDQRCIAKNPNDMRPPMISAVPTNLPNIDYRYTTTASGATLADSNYPNGCIPPYSGLVLKINTTIEAQCKYSLNGEPPATFDAYAYGTDGGSTSFLINHTVIIPNSANPNAYAGNKTDTLVRDDNNYDVYFMCKSVNGVSTPMPYDLHFCVSKEPDNTAPTIIGADLNNSYITSGKLNALDTIYTNKPANCKWDFVDRNYKDMAYNMTNCSQGPSDYVAGTAYSYGCIANFTGIKKGPTNYYVRCISHPSMNCSDENLTKIYGGCVSNAQSTPINLIGTSPLAIESISVGEKDIYVSGENMALSNFTNSTDPINLPITVKTLGGAEGNGNAQCKYNILGTNQNYQFLNGGALGYVEPNVDSMALGAGEQKVNVSCCDAAGNCDSKLISFNTSIDTTPPTVTRAYYENGQMNVLTDEKSKCVYSATTCNYAFSDGIPFTTVDGIDHTTPWNSQTDLHVKCVDMLGNYPGATDCQIILRASTNYNQTNP